MDGLCQSDGRLKLDNLIQITHNVVIGKNTVTGSPAWDYTKTLKAQSLFRNLPELFDRVMNLERKI